MASLHGAYVAVASASPLTVISARNGPYVRRGANSLSIRRSAGGCPRPSDLLLSSAVTFEVKTARLYVVDHDHTVSSRALVERLRASGRFVVAGLSPPMQRADAAVLARGAGAILVIPTDFERSLVRERGDTVQLVLNAEDGAAAGVTALYASQVVASYARERSGRRPQGRQSRPRKRAAGTMRRDSVPLRMQVGHRA